MFKIIKTKISAAEDSSVIGINTNYRTTISYNDQQKTITVLVEKAKRPDLTRDEGSPTLFEEVQEKTFNQSDFISSSDNGSWFVDFDVSTEQITAPIDLFDWMSSTNKGNSNFHANIQSEIFKRYNENYLPVLYVKNLDKDSVNFDHTVLICYVADTTDDATDTIVNAAGAESMSSIEMREWLEDNLKPEITFSILDSDGNTVGTLSKTQKNRYRTSLPSGKYEIQVSCAKPNFSSTPNVYTLNNVNGFINKNRLVLADGQTLNVGSDLTGLSSGEYFKLKLNFGKFISYSELWIDIE